MKIKDKRLLIYVAALAALTALATVLRTVACFTDLDGASGHFTDKALFTASAVTVAVGVVLAISYIAFGKARQNVIADFHGAGTYITSGLLALGFVFLGIEMITGVLLSDELISGAQRFFAVIVLLSAFVSVAYLFLNPYLGRRYSEKRGAFGIAPIVCLAAYATYLFMDTSLPINAPNKLVDQLAYITAAVFFCGEIRLSLGREKWGLYAASGMTAMLLTAYSSVPSLILYFSRLITEGSAVVIADSIAESALTVALFAFTAVRVISVAFLKDDELGSVARMISEKKAEMPEEDVAAAAEPEDENQISIDDIIAETPEEISESENEE